MCECSVVLVRYINNFIRVYLVGKLIWKVNEQRFNIRLEITITHYNMYI